MIQTLYIAGHTGLLGSALVRRFSLKASVRLVTVPRAQLDLTKSEEVQHFLKDIRPDAVIVAAGRVGGIAANQMEPAEFIYENLMIEANLIHGAWKSGVKSLLNFGSSCMYPRECPQPMRPVDLMTGPLEPTSEPYAIAKLAGWSLCTSYNRQYGTRFLTAIPATLYGPGDHPEPLRAHVLSSLLVKFHEARQEGRPEVTLWGTGTPRRDFLYVDDAAEACEVLLERADGDVPVNIGSGRSVSIQELALGIAEVVGFKGTIRWDATEPDGAPEKLLDNTQIRRLGWAPKTRLDTGLEDTYRWFLETQLCRSL